MKPHHKLILSLIVGSLVGLICHNYNQNQFIQNLNSYLLEPLGQIFLRSIFMIVVPMVVSGLIVGVYQLTSHHGLATVAKKTLFYTLLASSISVLVGIAMVNLIQPGQGISLPQLSSETTTKIQGVQKNVEASKSAGRSGNRRCSGWFVAFDYDFNTANGNSSRGNGFDYGSGSLFGYVPNHLECQWGFSHCSTGR